MLGEKSLKIAKALIIDTPHIDRILSGEKVWEMRGTRTVQRGRVALIRKGSGHVVGTVELVDSLGPLTQEQMLENEEQHLIQADRIRRGEVDKWKHAWVMRDPRVLARPVAYRHPPGAVIWVNLEPEVATGLG